MPNDPKSPRINKSWIIRSYKHPILTESHQPNDKKIALRWRTEQEVIIGKGQFLCGNKSCTMKDLTTWEVNFGYQEHGEKKNALVKIRLCPDCSKKLNHHSKKREVKRIKSKSLIGHKKKESHILADKISTVDSTSTSNETSQANTDTSENYAPWESLKIVESKSRDEEMEEYLQEMLL